MSFKAIKGQAKAIERLKAYMGQDHLAGAYLFTGPEGIGKYLTARTLAKALNCLEKESDACDACASCLKIDKDQHPDVHVIDASDSEIKIEYVRQLQKEINLRPYEGRKKVFIMRSAHNLNSAAANALLKTLEEPAGNSLIILVTEKPALLFKTVISRCQIVKFSSFSREALEGMLRQDYNVDYSLAHYLAFFCEGRLGRALGLKDSAIMKEKNAVIDEFGTAENSGELAQPPRERQDVRRDLNILAAWFRDIYLIKIGMPHSDLINLDRKSDLLKFMNRFSFLELDEILRCISDSLLYLEQNINARLLLSNLKLSLKG